jgi:putative PIN family toxin of toxin-antitoxin system
LRMCLLLPRSGRGARVAGAQNQATRGDAHPQTAVTGQREAREELVIADTQTHEQEIPRVVLDTNLIVAAYWNRRSASAKVLSACLDGRLSLFYSEQIRKEIHLILRSIRAKDEFKRRVDKALASGTEIGVPGFLSVVKDDPEDDKFLECALYARAEYVVTSDEHLLRIGEFEGIRIIKPIEMQKVFAP